MKQAAFLRPVGRRWHHDHLAKSWCMSWRSSNVLLFHYKRCHFRCWWRCSTTLST